MSDSKSVTTTSITTPTFSESGTTSKTVKVTYPSGCGSTYTCTYSKDGGSDVTVTSTTASVTFTSSGSLVAKVSDGTNTVSSSYTVTVSFPISNLTKNVVTSGDGLYKDSTELGRYVYKGADPNNYITLGSDTYRIISVESDGTLKVIKNGSIVSMAFDTSNTRYSTVSTDYCNSTYGCKVWGSKTTTLNSSGNNVTTMPREVGGTKYTLPSTEASLNTYLNNDWYNSLDSSVKSKIVTHMFNVGVVKKTSGQTLATDISQEQAYKWKGKVGLMNVTDYVKANSNTSLCGTVYANSYSAGNYSTCKTTNWIWSGPAASSYSWTIAPSSRTNANYVFLVISGNILDANAYYHGYGAAPVLYLSSNIQLSGKGTSGEPYIIS